ncbi:hypothetical protein [Thauera sp. SDU_THAU2]|uniref:hypothetical protein n=1 Tax=Thauera sp. SDU_THAU2 TaxID=3136633 RepID=UPI00311D42C8
MSYKPFHAGHVIFRSRRNIARLQERRRLQAAVREQPRLLADLINAVRADAPPIDVIEVIDPGITPEDLADQWRRCACSRKSMREAAQS